VYVTIPVPVVAVVDPVVLVPLVAVVVVVPPVVVVATLPPVPPLAPPVPEVPPPALVDVVSPVLLLVPDPQPVPDVARTPATPTSPRPTFHHDEAFISSLLWRAWTHAEPAFDGSITSGGRAAQKARPRSTSASARREPAREPIPCADRGLS
jgi:hypothetical protein